MYEERTSWVRGAVAWRSTSDGSTTRVLPDGCLDLLWRDGSVVVAGPDSTAAIHRGPAGSEVVGLRLAPGTGSAVIGVPAAEVTDRLVLTAELWGEAAADRLANQIHDAADPAAALEQIACAAIARADPPPPLLADVVDRLRSGVDVATVADAVGLSERQLHRRSLDAFGYGPKRLARILRFQQALAAARRGERFAAVAASCGYADQAHLAREVKALAGVPLGQLVSAAASS